MYGLHEETLADLIRVHRLARGAKDESHMKNIEEILTDRNYHTIAGLLRTGEYDKAAELHQPTKGGSL